VDGDEPKKPKNFNLSNSTEVSKVILKNQHWWETKSWKKTQGIGTEKALKFQLELMMRNDLVLAIFICN